MRLLAVQSTSSTSHEILHEMNMRSLKIFQHHHVLKKLHLNTDEVLCWSSIYFISTLAIPAYLSGEENGGDLLKKHISVTNKLHM